MIEIERHVIQNVIWERIEQTRLSKRKVRLLADFVQNACIIGHRAIDNKM